jgi:hypothetical protein
MDLSAKTAIFQKKTNALKMKFEKKSSSQTSVKFESESVIVDTRVDQLGPRVRLLVVSNKK